MSVMASIAIKGKSLNNSLADDWKLDVSKYRAFADDNLITMAEMFVIVFDTF